MATAMHSTWTHFGAELRDVNKVHAALWLATAGVLAAAFALLTLAVVDGGVPSEDRTVLAWVTELDVPLLAGFSAAVSGATSNYPLIGVGAAGIIVLWLLGMTRAALGFILVGGVVGAVAYGSDLTIGELVGRSRPLDASSESSFPSGHVFGTTVLFGILAWLAIYNKLSKKILIPLLGFLLAMMLAVGFSRMFEQAHWPTDVAAGYVLGAFWIMVLSTALAYVQRIPWLISPRQAAELDILDCEACSVESSIASTVVLDPERGTATKVYRPPGLVRLIYWLSFQASFPYEHNRASLDAATYRRKIASALTIHRFGKDLVAHVTRVSCMYGPCDFVTEFIPGEKVENDDATKEFLGQVAETFAEAGLSVWQINPRNPHAHTNLIRSADGEPIIIDLESAVVTPIPAPGQWRSALRRGNIPIFDDIDFEQLRRYISANESALESSLGKSGLEELRDDVARCEDAIRTWQDSEPRIWGRLIRGAYRLLDWKRLYMRLSHGMHTADRVAQDFLDRGIERWEATGRLSPSETIWLREHLSSGQVQVPLHHLGVHLVLSVVIVVPVPGVRSLARFLWTAGYWIKERWRRVRGGAAADGTPSNIHTPLVMVISLVPGFGAGAYMAARPLRKKLLIRLMLDQLAFKLPFRLYHRTRLGRLLAPRPQEASGPAD